MSNKGRVYFALCGDFDPEDITQKVGIEPTNAWRAHEKDPIHKLPRSSLWEYSSPTISEELVDIYELSKGVVEVLSPKKAILKEILFDHEISAILQVVLYISMDEEISTPAIGFEAEVIDFLSYLGAYIDIDTYKQ